MDRMDPNPYESPKTPDPTKKKVSAGRMGTAVVLGLLTIPAAVIACFTTCLATGAMTNWSPSTAPFAVGGIFGIAAAAGMIYLAARAGRGSPK